MCPFGWIYDNSHLSSSPPARPVILIVEVYGWNCREVFLRTLPVQLKIVGMVVTMLIIQEWNGRNMQAN